MARRDAQGRFVGGTSATPRTIGSNWLAGLAAGAGRRTRLRRNKRRVAQGVKALAGISGGTMGRSEGVRALARKLTRSQRVNERAERQYRARAVG